MTDMPQMVAIYNGMGGGAAAAIAAVEFTPRRAARRGHPVLATLGALIGAVAFSGSCVAFAKLQGVMKKASGCRRRTR
jgi:NAD(P) transhydrogenase subunit beta